MVGQKILTIGGHGMLGRPVVRRLLKEGFQVRNMSRRPEAAAALLPSAVECVAGDLKQVESIRSAAEGVAFVYLNLATYKPNAPFKPEKDGTANVIEALKRSPDTGIAKISALGVADGPVEGWPEACLKYEADRAVIASGHPYLIFYPSWFMESIPLMIKGPFLMQMGGVEVPIRWISGDDLGRSFAAALRDRNAWNRTYCLEGPEALTVGEACKRFTSAYDKAVLRIPNPLWTLKLAGTLLPLMKNFVQIVKRTNAMGTAFRAQAAWDQLVKPDMSIEQYVAYIKEYDDWPVKSLI